MSEKVYLKLDAAEATVAQAAAQVYAAYIAAGRVTIGQEDKWLDRSVEEAIHLAVKTAERVVSSKEVGGGGMGRG